jgi:hypothetical protein
VVVDVLNARFATWSPCVHAEEELGLRVHEYDLLEPKRMSVGHRGAVLHESRIIADRAKELYDPATIGQSGHNRDGAIRGFIACGC